MEEHLVPRSEEHRNEICQATPVKVETDDFQREARVPQSQD